MCAPDHQDTAVLHSAGERECAGTCFNNRSRDHDAASEIEVGSAKLVIDHAYFNDPEGYDLDSLLDGVLIARELAQAEPLSSYIGEEIDPTRVASTREELIALVPTISKHNYHPACSCKMGLADDPMAVVDQDGKVHGLDGLYVIDASIMPIIVRANTNLPTIAMAEKLSASLSTEHAAGSTQ